MGDSDDEFDKRRGRDKFRRERPDYAPERRERGGWEEGRGRGDWRGKRDRESYHDFDRGGRGGGGYRGSPPRYGSPPQAKKIKRDWEETDHGASNWTPGDMPPPQSTVKGPADLDFPTQPPMMTFKSFLAQQDDNIMDEEAIKKFNEYKLDFKKQQINEFFLQHKDEEWFKNKYFPEEYEKHKHESQRLVELRCEVFSKLLSFGLLDKCSCDVDKGTEIIKLMDAAVILMEGGTEFDLQSLEDEYKFYAEEKPLSRQVSEATVPTATGDKDKSPAENKRLSTEESASATAGGEENKNAAGKEKPLATGEQEVDDDDEGDGEIKDDDDDEEEEGKAEAVVNKEEPESGAVEGGELDESTDKKEEEVDEFPEKDEKIQENGIDKSNVKKGKKSRNTNSKTEDGEEEDSGSDSLSDSSDSELDEPEKNGNEPPPPGMEGSNPDAYLPSNANPSKEANQVEEKEQDTSEPMEEEEGDPKPRPLHRTQSIFLRSLAPAITRQEIEALCKKYPGFLRLSLQDPAPERRFYRRGWATFNQRVNIKEICWNLTNIRLRDTELGAIVNRELKQRVRKVDGITACSAIAKADIKHCAKIVQAYDKRWGLWQGEKGDQEKERKPRFGLISNNPVLANITDYLVDEGSYEEEAYLGKSLDEPSREGNPEVPFEREEELLKVLDRMILYLRVVHSFDYYSCVEYPNEDEMPHRCGILHCRGPPPLNRITQGEIDEHNGQFDRKITPMEEVKVTLTAEEAARLGLKDQESEVEKYIQANTQELAKDKWLCPLSGKKFKGPDFVRKHIQNKHGEKLEETKHEVFYFNNYLMDPKRPQLPEHPANKHGGVPSGGRSADPYSSGPTTPGGGGGGSAGTGSEMRGAGSGYQPPPYHHQGGSGGYGGQGGGYGGYRGGPPMPYGHRGRGGPPSRGYQSNYGRGGYNNYHDKPDYRNRERSYDRNYQNQNRRDRSRQDPRGIVEYRDLDALKEDSDTFFVLDES